MVAAGERAEWKEAAGLPEDLEPLWRHLQVAYPEEGCAVIYRGPAGFRFVPLENAANRYHALDPSQYPRTARNGYLFDPKQWLRTEQEAETRGETLHCIVHSHPDVGAYFSAEDRVQAAPDGLPLYPGVHYLVVAVDRGRVTDAKLFTWVDGEWVEQSVPACSAVG